MIIFYGNLISSDTCLKIAESLLLQVIFTTAQYLLYVESELNLAPKEIL